MNKDAVNISETEPAPFSIVLISINGLHSRIFYIVDDIIIFLPMVIHFTVSDVKFLVPIRFLKKGFRSDYF